MSVGYQNGGADQQSKGQGQSGDTADWDTLKEDVSQIADAAVERGRTFMDSARHQATDYVDRRKDDLAQSVADLAESLREATRPFEDRPNIRTFVDSAAEGLDQLADSIRARTFADVFNDMEDVVRQRPAVFAAATFALGFFAARFIKSSAESLREEAHRPNRGSAGSNRSSQMRGGGQGGAGRGRQSNQSRT